MKILGLAMGARGEGRDLNLDTAASPLNAEQPYFSTLETLPTPRNQENYESFTQLD
jgi:hypothetical protein